MVRWNSFVETPKRIVSEIFVGLGGSKQAFFGQALAFITLLLPILAGKSSWLAPLAFGSAISTVLVPLITLSARTIYQIAPVDQVKKLIKLSMVFVVLFVTVPAVACIVLVVPYEVSVWIFCIASINIGIPIYNMAFGLAIRTGSVIELSRLRLTANVIVFLLTIFALFAADFGPVSLALAIGVGFGLPALFTLVKLVSQLSEGVLNKNALNVTQSKILRDVSISSISSAVHQSYALVLPALGPYAASWALVCRIVSGFETIGGNIAGPYLEAKTLLAIQGQNLVLFKAAQNLRRGFSVLLGLTSSVMTLAVLWFDSLYGQILIPDGMTFWLAATLYAFCFAYLAVSGPLLYVLRYELRQLNSDVIKGLPLLLVLFNPSAESLLMTIAFSISVATFVLATTHTQVGKKYFGSMERGIFKRIGLAIYNQLFTSRLTQLIFLKLDQLVSYKRAMDAANTPVQMLYCSAFSGNIGDQAMADSFVLAVKGPKLIVTPYSPNEKQLSFYLENGARIKVIEGLVLYPNVQRLRALRNLSKLMSASSSFSVVGADVMDGGYSVFESLSRMSMLQIANNYGIPTRVLGFSWRPDAPQSLIKMLRKIGPTTKLFVRDPVSFSYLSDLRVKGINQSADSAFALDPDRFKSKPLDWLDERSGAFVCLNVSALISRRGGAQDGFGKIVEELHEAGVRIVFLPHVNTGKTNNDIEACRYVFSKFGNKEDVLVDEILSPHEILNLVRNASLVITGRMHLAILSMRMGVPAITFETQNKVKGLYRLFDLEDLVIDPFSSYQDVVIAKAKHILGSQEVQIKISRKLPEIQVVAASNFSGIA